MKTRFWSALCAAAFVAAVPFHVLADSEGPQSEKARQISSLVDRAAALIEQGTTQNQMVVSGSLDDIVQQANGMRPPAILIIGEVVRLRDQINWFIQQPDYV